MFNNRHNCQLIYHSMWSKQHSYHNQKLERKMWIFSYPYLLTYVLGDQKNCLIEMVLLSTNKICYDGEIIKIIFNYTLADRIFSPHFGNMTWPPEMEICCVILNKIGENSHLVILSNKTKKNKFQIFSSQISPFPNLEWKNNNNFLCGTVKFLDVTKWCIFCSLNLEFSPWNWIGRKLSFCHWECDPISVI